MDCFFFAVDRGRQPEFTAEITEFAESLLFSSFFTQAVSWSAHGSDGSYEVCQPFFRLCVLCALCGESSSVPVNDHEDLFVAAFVPINIE